MPIYEYRCLECDEVFEDLVISPRGNSTARCPSCGGERVKRLFSTFGFKSTKEATTSGTGAGCSTCTATSCASCR